MKVWWITRTCAPNCAFAQSDNITMQSCLILWRRRPRSVGAPDAAEEKKKTAERENEEETSARTRQKEHWEGNPFSLAFFSFLGFIVSSQFHRDKPTVWVSRRSVNRAEIGLDLEVVLCQAWGHSSIPPGFSPPPPFHKVIIWCSDL